MRRYEKVGFPIPEEGEGKYLEKKIFFAEEKKNGERNGGKKLEKENILLFSD